MQFIKTKSEFEPIPEGRQAAVLAEVSFAIMSFELKAENKKGERFIKDVELFPSFTVKNQAGKLFASWSGKNEGDLLTQAQLNVWMDLMFGDLIERDAEGKIKLDEDESPIFKDFETEQDMIKAFNKMGDPKAVGKTCYLGVIHNESDNGKVYANVKKIYVNAKLDDDGNVKRDPETKRIIPAFQMEVSDAYVSYAQRMKEMRDRMNRNDSKPAAASKSKKAADVDDSEIPF